MNHSDPSEPRSAPQPPAPSAGNQPTGTPPHAAGKSARPRLRLAGQNDPATGEVNATNDVLARIDELDQRLGDLANELRLNDLRFPEQCDDDRPRAA